jgi:hypothetical protein
VPKTETGDICPEDGASSHDGHEFYIADGRVIHRPTVPKSGPFGRILSWIRRFRVRGPVCDACADSGTIAMAAVTITDHDAARAPLSFCNDHYLDWTVVCARATGKAGVP